MTSGRWSGLLARRDDRLALGLDEPHGTHPPSHYPADPGDPRSSRAVAARSGRPPRASWARATRCRRAEGSRVTRSLGAASCSPLFHGAHGRDQLPARGTRDENRMDGEALALVALGADVRMTGGVDAAVFVETEVEHPEAPDGAQ